MSFLIFLCETLECLTRPELVRDMKKGILVSLFIFFFSYKANPHLIKKHIKIRKNIIHLKKVLYEKEKKNECESIIISLLTYYDNCMIKTMFFFKQKKKC